MLRQPQRPVHRSRAAKPRSLPAKGRRAILECLERAIPTMVEVDFSTRQEEVGLRQISYEFIGTLETKDGRDAAFHGWVGLGWIACRWQPIVCEMRINGASHVFQFQDNQPRITALPAQSRLLQ